MGWLFELHKTQPIAHAVGVLTFVCVLGMVLGSVKFRGIGLGTSGVLFDTISKKMLQIPQFLRAAPLHQPAGTVVSTDHKHAVISLR